MRKSALSLICLCFLTASSSAQSNWGLRGNIGVEKKIAKGLEAGLEANYHP